MVLIALKSLYFFMGYFRAGKQTSPPTARGEGGVGDGIGG